MLKEKPYDQFQIYRHLGHLFQYLAQYARRVGHYGGEHTVTSYPTYPKTFGRHLKQKAPPYRGALIARHNLFSYISRAGSTAS